MTLSHKTDIVHVQDDLARKLAFLATQEFSLWRMRLKLRIQKSFRWKFYASSFLQYITNMFDSEWIGYKWCPLTRQTLIKNKV